MLAEDHNSARQAYAAIINGEPNMKITGQAGNGLELLKLVEADAPDIVVTDIEMPVMNGLELIDKLKRRFPNVKPIILSMHNEDYYISQLILNGACAYLPKSCDIDDILLAINRVYTEGYFFTASVSKIIVSTTMKESGQEIAPLLKQLSLSAREIDVLKLVCDEKSNKQIADHLNLSQATIDFHRQSIYKKTQASSVVGLVKYAIKNGITGLD